jgi:PAS domain S-box-containing protein
MEGSFVKGILNLRFLGLIFLMLFPQALPLQEEEQPARVLLLNQDQEKYSLGTYLEILRDSSGELTIQDVNSTAYQSQFVPSQVEIPNFGYQDAPYWVRFRVQNQTESSRYWVLVLGFRNMHYMDLYVPEPDSDTYSVIKSGVLRAGETPNLSFEKLSFELEIPPETEQTFYIRFQSEATMTLPLTLMSPEVFSEHAMVTQMVSGVFYGTLLVLMVYNSILYALIREKNFLHLVLFSVSAFVHFLFFHATIIRFFPNTPPGLSTTILPVAFGFFILTLVMFVDSFLELNNSLPKIHLIANFLKGIALSTSVISLFIQYQVISTIQVILVIIVLPAILALNLFLAWRGDRSAKLLLGSLPVFLIGAILVSLVRLGILASSSFTEELARFGLIWLVAFWSLALADRMNTLKKESETSRRQIIENERRMVQYMDCLPVGVLVYDGDANLRYINRQSNMILNQPGIETPVDHFLYRKIEEASDPSNLSIPDSNYPHPIELLPVRHAIQQGTSAYFDHIEINLGDTNIPVEVWSNPLMDDTGKFSGTVVAFQNIQDRLNQEEKLRRSEEFRQKILEGSSVGTWMNDFVNGEVIWDSRTREIFGVKPDEPATLELGFSLIHPEDRMHAQKAFDKAIAPKSNGSYEEEKRIIRPDGQVRWISTRGNLIFVKVSGKRQAARMVGIVLDVTTQKQAEIELEKSRLQYKNLVETMNEGLAIVDENMILTYANPRLSEMFGYAQKDMIGKHVDAFFDQENFAIVADQFTKRIEGHEKSYTVTLRRKDGSGLHSLIAPAVVFDEQGMFLHSIAVISDINDQFQIQQLLDQRIRERKEEIASLMEVSRIVVSSLGSDDQLKTILAQLRAVIHCDGASVVLRKENMLIAETFQQKIPHEMTENLVRPFYQPEMISEHFWQDEALVFKNCRGQAQEERDFCRLTENIFGSVPFEMVSWIGIPVRSRNSLIGVLNAHAGQEDFFTPAMAELMQAFANQIAIVFENNRLYKQARALAAAGERNRLARELHDSVTQSLYSVRLYAEAVRSALTAGKIPAADKNLDQLISIAREGMSDLRLLIFDLKPPVLEELGLLGAIQKRLEMVETRAGIQAEFIVEGEPELPQDFEIQLYWAVYEALSNVLKHAKAKHVFLNFSFSAGRSIVIIQDDGVGFDLEKLNLSQSSGLKNIIDRVEDLGGSIKIDSKPGEGTSIRIVLVDPAHFP